MPWHRYYRPQKIAELHLKSVKKQLLPLLTAATFPQVLLFAGPKGTGKTSSARIIAALLNDPQNKAATDARFKAADKNPPHFLEPDSNNPTLQEIFSGTSYLIQEIDAASNRGIDDIRMLKERVYIPPQFGSMSVYILDEAHMLTTEAWNALLKLLEEPPQHAVFIMATTEIHKIPDTVLSRASLVQFQTATNQELMNALKEVAIQEKITVDQEVLEMISTAATGSFRDAVKLLEQLTLSQKTDTESAREFLAITSDQNIQDLVTSILQKDPTKVSNTLQHIRSLGIKEAVVLKQLTTYLYSALISAQNGQPLEPKLTPAATTFLLRAVLDPLVTAPSPIPLLGLEVMILDLLHKAQKKAPAPTSAPIKVVVEDEKKAVSKKSEEAKKSVQTQKEVPFTPELLEKVNQEWQEFISSFASTAPSLATILKSSVLESDTNTLKILVEYPIHATQLSDKKNVAMVETNAQKFFGFVFPFIVTVKKKSEDDSLSKDILESLMY